MRMHGQPETDLDWYFRQINDLKDELQEALRRIKTLEETVDKLESQP